MTYLEEDQRLAKLMYKFIRHKQYRQKDLLTLLGEIWKPSELRRVLKQFDGEYWKKDRVHERGPNGENWTKVIYRALPKGELL